MNVNTAYQQATIMALLNVPISQNHFFAVTSFLRNGADYSIECSIWNNIGISIRSCLGSSIGSSIGSNVMSNIGRNIGSGIGSSIGISIGSSIVDSIGSSIENIIRSNVGSSIERSIGNSIESSIVISMGSKEIEINFLYSRILGKGLLIRLLAATFYVVFIVNFLNCNFEYVKKNLQQ